MSTEGIPGPLNEDRQAPAGLGGQDGGVVGECLLAEEPESERIEYHRNEVVRIGPGRDKVGVVLLLLVDVAEMDVDGVDGGVPELLEDDGVKVPDRVVLIDVGVPKVASRVGCRSLRLGGKCDLVVLGGKFLVGLEIAADVNGILASPSFREVCVIDREETVVDLGAFLPLGPAPWRSVQEKKFNECTGEGVTRHGEEKQLMGRRAGR